MSLLDAVFMDVGKIVIGFLLILGMLCMSGCVNEGTTTEKNFENITFESDVVELEYASLEFETEVMHDEFSNPYDKIKSAEVKYLLHNPQDRHVTVQVDVYLYDENNTLLYSEEGSQFSLPKGYTEHREKYNNDLTRVTLPVSYKGEDVALVDYATIIAYEI